jgi:hypothetical protein
MAELRMAGLQSPFLEAPSVDQQAPCHGEKTNKMMTFAISEQANQSAIGAASGRFFRFLWPVRA